MAERTNIDWGLIDSLIKMPVAKLATRFGVSRAAIYARRRTLAKGPPQRPVRTPWDEIDELLRGQTVSVKEIAKRFSLTDSAIYKRRRVLGFTRANLKELNLPPSTSKGSWAEIDPMLRAAEVPIAALAKRFGITPGAIYKRRRKLGLKRATARTPGRETPRLPAVRVAVAKPAAAATAAVPRAAVPSISETEMAFEMVGRELGGLLRRMIARR